MFFRFLFLAIFSLTFIPQSYSGEIYEEGTVLKDKSYVFSIEEATRLMERLEELERAEKELTKYKELEEIREKQIDLYAFNEDFYKTQIEQYKIIEARSQDLILKYQKRDKLNDLEKAGFFVLGIGLTFGTFYIANNINSN